MMNTSQIIVIFGTVATFAIFIGAIYLAKRQAERVASF
jgi:hypothetical protein